MSNNSIKLYSGKYYDFLEPTTDMIDIHDITHALSTEQRFSNHLLNEWSVLQHVLLCVFIAKKSGVNPEEQYTLLHHDDPEAYFKDLSTPLKSLCKDYKRLYALCANVVGSKFDLPYNINVLNETLHGFDKITMQIEDTIFGSTYSEWHDMSLERIDIMDENLGGLKDFIRILKESNRYNLKQKYLKAHKNLRRKLELEVE